MSGVSGTVRVLHVDDDPAFADTAATFLEREDERFVVDTATGAEAGLEYLARSDVDCVVSDYDMPGTDGIEFLRAVREEFPDLPFILYTGKGSEEVAAEAISAGVTDYLQKGRGTSQYAVLANRITNAVGATRSAAEAERRRHRLEQLLKTVPGCVVQLDADGRFVFANQRAEAVLGLEQDEVTARAYNDPDWDIRDLDNRPIPDEELPFRRVLDTGEPLYGYRHTIQWPDGTRKVLLVNGAPLFDEEGAVESVVFSLTDITDQYDQETELAKTRHRLELALEVTDTGVWEWDLETDEVVWSETLEQVMGLDPGEFEGTFEAFADRVHPDDLPRVKQEVERAVETGSMYQTELRMRHEDGGVRWAEVRGQLVPEEGGERLVGVHHDITGRKERQRDLEAMKRRLEAILENTTTPMFMKDRDGEYLFVNRGYRELFGLHDEEIAGHTDHEIHPPDMAEEVRRNDRTVIERGEPVETEERIVVDGEERVFLTSKVPIYDTGERSDPDEPVAVFGVGADVSEREAAERELRRKNQRLEKFAHVVSHDLRSPLNVADGRLALAREESDSEHLAAIDNALGRMERIIDDVLWLARSGQDIRETEPVDLAETAEAAWGIVADARDSATLVVEGLRATDGSRIEADGDRLQQLLENLFRNAVEHGSTSNRTQSGDAVEHGSTSSRTQSDDAVEHGDDVTVTFGRSADGFYVEDDGPGIPDAARDEVFETGYSTSADGTGFGLSIVRQIVEAHDWQIRVTDGSDGGARVEITGVSFLE